VHDRAVDHLRDLGEVQAVEVMQHHHEPVLRPELVDGGEHESAELRLFRDVRRGTVFVRDRHIDGIVQGGEDDAFARAPVVREVDRDSIQPGTQRCVRLEAGKRPVRSGERVDDDLFRGGRVLRDRETQPEDPIAVSVEERVERDGVAVARRVDQVVVGASIPGRAGRAVSSCGGNLRKVAADPKQLALAAKTAVLDHATLHRRMDELGRARGERAASR